jgi:hypothetical protein
VDEATVLLRMSCGSGRSLLTKCELDRTMSRRWYQQSPLMWSQKSPRLVKMDGAGKEQNDGWLPSQTNDAVNKCPCDQRRRGWAALPSDR